MNRCYYTRHAPDYNLPEGYEIDGLNGNNPVADNQCQAKSQEQAQTKFRQLSFTQSTMV